MRVMIVSPYSLIVVGGVQGQVLGLARALRRAGRRRSRRRARATARRPSPASPPSAAASGSRRTARSPRSRRARRWPAHTLEALRVFAPDVVHLHEPLVPGPDAGGAARRRTAARRHVPCDVRRRTNRWYRMFRPPLRRWLEHARGPHRGVARRPRRPRPSRRSAARTRSCSRTASTSTRFAKADAVADARARRSSSSAGTSPARAWACCSTRSPGSSATRCSGSRATGPRPSALRARDIPGVEWLGRISEDEKARRLRGATISCVPSLGGESFGDRAARGDGRRHVPVVASDIDGYRNVARADVEALLVPPGDAGGAARRAAPPARRAGARGASWSTPGRAGGRSSR